jgi:Ca2+-transporting ATPase
MAGITLSVQFWATATGHANWQTMVFTTLCLTQLAHVLAIRSEKESLFRTGLFSNKYLFAAVLLTFVLQMATIYVPSLNSIFKTQPLTLAELAITLVLSSVIFWAVEIEKLIRRRRNTSGP